MKEGRLAELKDKLTITRVVDVYLFKSGVPSSWTLHFYASVILRSCTYKVLLENVKLQTTTFGDPRDE